MKAFDLGQIHPTAILSDKAKIGRNVTMGANVIVYDNVEIGDNVIIGPGSYIGEPAGNYYGNRNYSNPPLIIGANGLIRSGSIIYAGSFIGEKLECGHRVTIREDNRIGPHSRIGTLADIQNGCQIGEYVRLHSGVFLAQKSIIGNYVWIFPHAVLTNDPHPPSNVAVGAIVEDFAVIAAGAVVLPGVKIGRDAMIGAMALVRSDVPREAVMHGNPARQVATIRDIKSKYMKEPPYPWREHFERSMPWEGIGYNEWLRGKEKANDF